MTPRKRGLRLALFATMIMICAMFAFVGPAPAAPPVTENCILSLSPVPPPAPEVALVETGQCSCEINPLMSPYMNYATANSSAERKTTANLSTIDVKINERHGGIDHRPRMSHYRQV